MPEKLLDTFHLGLATSEEVEAKPYGFDVTWIKWDSGFRGTELQVGDRIIGINGTTYDADNRKDHERAPGGYLEEQYWEQQGAKDGQPVALTVWRDDETFTVTGSVRADRYYTTADGRAALGPDGPPRMSNDGFDEVWASWLEKFESRASRIFDHGWERTLNMRQELAEALEHGPRVEYLVKHYPGLLAKATQADFNQLIDCLRGKRYELTAADLEYRSLTKHRLGDAIAAGEQARKDFLARNVAVPLESIPALDPIRGDRQLIVGKIVEVPRVELISEAGHGWYVAQGAGGSVYLIDSRSPVLTGIYLAVERFKQIVAPDIDDKHQFIGRITDSPVMVASGRSVYTGLVIEVIADTVDGKVFVDVTSDPNSPKFANEAQFHRPPTVDTRADATPEQVMTSFFNALKLGDQDLWSSFFAGWTCEQNEDGAYIYDAEGAVVPAARNIDYLHARIMIMSTVYDVRVAKVSKPRVLLDHPKVEAVTVEVDHVGLFDGEYRAFRNAEVNRMWRLQRVDNGPWRIVSQQGI
jgi:hypothetical protein